MRDFVARILEPSAKNKFLPNFLPVVEEIARLGAVNSLSQTLLKLASPGVPDIYQGNEIWDFSLVDPDNRRPVDYQCRREKLASLKEAKPDELWQNWPDGRIKMFLTHRLLRFRREHVDLFRRGNYLPIAASGAFADCCISFARELDGEWIVVLAPRLSSRIGFPAHRRQMERHRNRTAGGVCPRKGARHFHWRRSLHSRSTSETGRRAVDPAVRSHDKL